MSFSYDGTYKVDHSTLTHHVEDSVDVSHLGRTHVWQYEFVDAESLRLTATFGDEHAAPADLRGTSVLEWTRIR